jgi:hypothetical protein
MEPNSNGPQVSALKQKSAITIVGPASKHIVIAGSFAARTLPEEQSGNKEAAMNIQAKVALDKEKHPELYCPVPHCLWRVKQLEGYEPSGRPVYFLRPNCSGGYCPRHQHYLHGLGLCPDEETERPGRYIDDERWGE